MRIALLHTAQVHVATFDDLFADKAPDAQLLHIVRADLLVRAQVGGLEVIAEPMMNALVELAEADVILCTCSTLGPLVDRLSSNKTIRIDRPMMQVAFSLGPKPLLAICLESTRVASLSLLQEAGEVDPTVLLCNGAWALFEAGDMEGYAQAIAAAVRPAALGHDCVVLGQASMRVAEPLLRDLDVPVLSSPSLAVDRAIAMALA